MVKIIELSDKERAEREKASKLMDIAKEIFTKAYYSAGWGNGILIRVNKEDISLHIHPPKNTIFIDADSQLKYAIKLAEKYEGKLGEDYTIMKDYRE